MRKLEHLQEDEGGKLSRENGSEFPNAYAYKVSGMKTITVEIHFKIRRVIDHLTKTTAFIPKDANAYVVSDYNRFTDYLGTKDNRTYTVLTFQFYHLAIYTSE
ncbi:MAG TPA: hypothetical protein VJB35_06955 [Candidatus Nanoarchaeia archaeon]|nr:hypothetical protein [Candidatus Nanoarchaeia archaeon]